MCFYVNNKFVFLIIHNIGVTHCVRKSLIPEKVSANHKGAKSQKQNKKPIQGMCTHLKLGQLPNIIKLNKIRQIKSVHKTEVNFL